MNDRICLRISGEDILLLKKISKSRGESLSSFVRRAIRIEFARLSYLPAADKKALGLKPFDGGMYNGK